jgi:hypothetical protein
LDEYYARRYHEEIERRANGSSLQRSAWGCFRIYSSGDVVPCIRDINAVHLKMGDVGERTISELFNSERWQEFPRLHQDGPAALHPSVGPAQTG